VCSSDLLIALAVVLLVTSILPISDARGGGSAPNVDPYIDALDCIEVKGLNPCDNWDPDTWPHTATIAVRDSPYGETEAIVKLRMEGKGDPIKKIIFQQSILVVDNSGSMKWNDNHSMRYDAAKFYVDQLAIPDEIGFVIYGQSLPSGQYAELRSSLTTNYQGTKTGMYGNASGKTPTSYGLKMATDEIIPKKKSDAKWAIIHLTDGCWEIGDDPQVEVNRMINEQITLFNLGLYSDPNSSEKQRCEPQLQNWSQQTGGKYYWIQNPADLAQVYKDLAQEVIYQPISGTPPRSGEPMVNFKLTWDIEVVPGSFRCGSGCTDPIPSSPKQIVHNNRGLWLQWKSPVSKLRIREIWEVTFIVRSFAIGANVKVNEVSESYVKYDRFDGSPGGNDRFDQITLKVNPSPPPPPPPPPRPNRPSVPMYVSAYPSKGAITLTWEPPESDGGARVQAYNIYRGTSANGKTLLTSAGPCDTAFIDENLTVGSMYYYRLSASNSNGEGDLSNEVSAIAPAQPGYVVTHTLRVWIRDALTHGPIAQATIRIEPTGEFGVTDLWGYREMAGLREGNYSVTIAAPGYETLQDRIQILGSDLTVSFYMVYKTGNGASGGPSFDLGLLSLVLTSVLIIVVVSMAILSLKRERRGLA
jgi:hypothetical protein